MNKVILVGRLAQDPEVRYTQGGKAVASFNLAVNRFGGGSAQKEFMRITLLLVTVGGVVKAVLNVLILVNHLLMNH